jgi:hypothetical protein
MGDVILGFILGLSLGIVLTIPDTDPASIETRAKAVYEQRAASLDWYEGDKHIEPWSKLSPEEQEQWRKPLRRYKAR